MGSLVADPNSLDSAGVNNFVTQFNRLPNSQQFLQTPGGGPITVTDNPESMSPGNQAQMRRFGVTVVDGKLVTHRLPGYGTLAGFNQNNGPKKIWLNLHPDSGTQPVLNTLTHEIGHYKWRGYGPHERHDDAFYKMLTDAESGLGLTPSDADLPGDMSMKDLDNVQNPLGGNIFGNTRK